MNLKEAFRYQNYLSEVFDTVLMRLNPVYAKEIKEEHRRSKTDPDAVDEVINKSMKRDFDCTIEELVGLAMYILEEKERLSRAIADAKSSFCPYIDADVSINNMRRRLCSSLGTMANMKSEEVTTTGQAYRFNVEGNQVPYTYEVVRHSDPGFDRNGVKRILRSTLKYADEVSSNVDRQMVDVALDDFDVVFDPSDTLEDVIRIFLSNDDELPEAEPEA